MGARRLALLVMIICMAAPWRPALADEDATAAKSYFERGMGHFNLEEYDAAIAQWENGYRLKPVPEFLYNIAQAYRLSKRAEKALTFYRKYLKLFVKAPNRAEVERHIAALQKVVDQQQNAANQPPTAPMVGPGRRGPEAAPDPEPVRVQPDPTPSATPAPSEPPPASADNAVSKSAPSKTPITKKPWFWGVIGGVGAAVVIGVVVGVVVGTSGGDSANNLGELRF
jgi:tetratricopeptide (TPR) repeat protein